MKRTTQDWIKELKELQEKTYVDLKYKTKINNKNVFFSTFYMYASEEQRNNRYLNILNFNKTHHVHEVPKEMIDLNFLKEVFNLSFLSSRASFPSKIFLLPYEWKNNEEDKKFLKEVLYTLTNRARDSRNDKINWSFESGFWADLEFTKEIKNYNYYGIDLEIIKELNNSKDKKETDLLLNIVEKDCYFLRHLKPKNKNKLSTDVVKKYVLNYGFTGLSKEHKNNYDIIKAAFHNATLAYSKIDEKWKTKEFLLDLLNNPEIWRKYINSSKLKEGESKNAHYLIHIDMLPPSFLKDEDLMKVCMLDGFNLLELKNINSDFYKDKEFKKLALKTYTDYRIIEDCLDDKEMILEFFHNLKSNTKMGYSGITLFSQTKMINEELFKDKEIMKTYLSIPRLNDYNFFSRNAITALASYDIDDLIEFININPEVYKLLPIELKSNWELVSTCYEHYKKPLAEMPNEVNFVVFNSGKKYEEVSPILKSYALNEKLQRDLENKKIGKKLKI